MSLTEPFFQKHYPRWITRVGRYSYEAFLVHHIILSFSVMVAAPCVKNNVLLVLLFVAQAVAIAIGAVSVNHVTRLVMRLCTGKDGKKEK